MKRIIHAPYLLIVLLFMFHSIDVNAQCGVGYTRDTLNWDLHDFLPNTGSYVTPTAYITLAQSQTQRFTFGTQKVTITHNYSGANDPGENTTNTAEAGSYGNGADVQFIGNGVITVTFQTAVQNVKFSVYDIDRSQKVTVTALNVAAPVVITTLAKLSGSVLTIAGSGTVSASATANTSTVANNVTDGTINVDITGPVTSFTLTVTATGTNGSEDGSFWLSDISACSAGTFTSNYYNPSKPFTGQPGYVLAARNDTVYYINPATGAAKFLFADYGNPYINSMGYDPNRHMLYYTYSLSAAGGTISTTDYVLRRYDYDLDTLGVLSHDVRTIGVPLYDQSIESGGAAFFDGSLYLGIEGGNSVSDRESSIWKIDLTGTYGISGLASQAFATPSDVHDWGDFGIYNGILYDFDGSGSGTDFTHINLLTGTSTRYAPSPSTLVPRQVGIDWNGQVYNIGSPSTIAAGTIAPYNYNGSVGTANNISFLGVNPVGSWGDAAEAFKPKTDFGDAPASYDPAGSDPAVTEEDDSLRLGNTVGIEWSKHTSVDATGDGAEEDGVTNPQVIPTGTSNFLLKVKVYNHTGANATLAGWIDKNGDGLFQAGEGVTATVASSPSLQLVSLLWSSINVTVPALGVTFMRLRITSAVNGMTTANPTGYFPNGEVEDYKVNVTIVLPDQNIALKAQKVNSKNVNLVWDVNDENGIDTYELQRSNDGSNWQTINERTAQGNVAGAVTYSFLDNDPGKPVSYFRVRVLKNTGTLIYSETKRIDFDKESSISISPNPAKDISKLDIQSANAGTAHISVLDFTGNLVSDEMVKVTKGANSFNLPVVQKLNNGVYKVRVQLDTEILVATLVVIK